mmetsp:Transcript_129311/g.335323  ORF Transcript_129311/g.335323 Transcript_129311/m.335323 type:complete len:247 (-) Transcript_129311:229-969(-)
MFMFSCCQSCQDGQDPNKNMVDDESLAVYPTILAEQALSTKKEIEVYQDSRAEETTELAASESTDVHAEGGEVLNTFTAILVKESVDEDLGWDLDLLAESRAWVSNVSHYQDTPLQRYNASVPPEKQLREGDYIKQVNQKAGSVEAMMSALKQDLRLEIVVQRPHVYTKTIVKGGQSMGLALVFGPGSASIIIETVKDGVVKQLCPEVRSGDRITKVNGQRGTSDSFLQTMKASESVDIEFSRCGP